MTLYSGELGTMSIALLENSISEDLACSLYPTLKTRTYAQRPIIIIYP